MEIFRLKDYQDKNILIIGNKPIKQLFNLDIDEREILFKKFDK